MFPTDTENSLVSGSKRSRSWNPQNNHFLRLESVGIFVLIGILRSPLASKDLNASSSPKNTHAPNPRFENFPLSGRRG